MRSESSYKKFLLDPVKAPADAAGEVEPAAQEVEVAEQVEVAASVPVSDVPVASPAAASPVSPSSAIPSSAIANVDPHMLATPAFKPDEPLPPAERWLWAIPIALALGLGAWLLYDSALAPRRHEPRKLLDGRFTFPPMPLEPCDFSGTRSRGCS